MSILSATLASQILCNLEDLYDFDKKIFLTKHRIENEISCQPMKCFLAAIFLSSFMNLLNLSN